MVYIHVNFIVSTIFIIWNINSINYLYPIFFSLSNKVVFIVHLNFEYTFLISSPSALLEYFDRLKSFVGQ